MKNADDLVTEFYNSIKTTYDKDNKNLISILTSADFNSLKNIIEHNNQSIIEKACKWLEDKCCSFWIEDFKKYIEYDDN